MHTYHTNYLLYHTEHSIHTLIRSGLKIYPVQVRRLSHIQPCVRLTCACFSLNVLPGFSKWRNKTLSLSSSECSPGIAVLGRDVKSCRNTMRSSEGWKHDFLWSIKRLCWMGKIRENHLWDFQWQDIAPLPPTA